MKRLFSYLPLLIVGLASCVISPEQHPSPEPEYMNAFSDTIDGKKVELFLLRNDNGMEVALSNYGAAIVSIRVPDKNGKIEDVTLSYDSLSDLRAGKSYFGCIVGRFANRIGGAQFTLDGVTYNVPKNDGNNALHGGVNSIDKQVWKARKMNDAIRFTIDIPDGENGYPGTMKVTVVYSLKADNSLVIDYTATTDQPTVVNLTNHVYFNLSGDPSRTILNHEVAIRSSQFTPVESTLIPTGELKAVKGTPFDFSASKPIGRDINMDDQQLVFGKGYDHNFVLDKRNPSEAAVVVVEPVSGRKMEVFTTQPGVQFYTGNFLNGTEKGRGVSYAYRTGFCLETQQFPDAPNKSQFPSPVLRPGEKWVGQTIYRFSIQ